MGFQVTIESHQGLWYPELCRTLYPETTCLLPSQLLSIPTSTHNDLLHSLQGSPA